MTHMMPAESIIMRAMDSLGGLAAAGRRDHPNHAPAHILDRALSYLLMVGEANAGDHFFREEESERMFGRTL